MTFKQNWEKTVFQLPAPVIEDMIAQAFPGKKLLSFKAVSDGCANLNIRINLEKEHFILRVYLRDKDAAYREQKIGKILKDTLPAPQIYYIGDYENYRFAIVQHFSGITLRDLLLSSKPNNMPSLMFDAGAALVKIQRHVFESSGFFDKNLQIIEPISKAGYMNHATACVEKLTDLQLISTQMITKINLYLTKFQDIFPDGNEKQLVHGDYDPANILVNKINNQWQITGILDWEFTFAGTFLTDIANMLRYAHQMPASFEKSFLQGVQENGVELANNWKKKVDLLNLTALIDILARTTTTQPNQIADIYALITMILSKP